MAESNIRTTISFFTDDDKEVFFVVMEQTMLNGTNYLLVTEDTDEDEAEALILKEVSGANQAETTYDIVEDEKELSALADVFSELLDDVTFKME